MKEVTPEDDSVKAEAESPRAAPEQVVTETEASWAEQLGLVTDSVAFSIIDDLLQFKKVRYISNYQQPREYNYQQPREYIHCPHMSCFISTTR